MWIPGGRVIVSGTGLSMEELKEAFNSTVVKESDPPTMCWTDTGFFDNRADQQEYMEQYMPPQFLNTVSGQALVSRIELWLHGR
jgi:hypothetical protein